MDGRLVRSKSGLIVSRIDKYIHLFFIIVLGSVIIIMQNQILTYLAPEYILFREPLDPNASMRH